MEKVNKEEQEIFMKKNISATSGKLGRLFLDLGHKKYIYIFGRLPKESWDLDHTNLLGTKNLATILNLFVPNTLSLPPENNKSVLWTNGLK